MLTSFHGWVGKSDIWIGSRVPEDAFVACQGMHRLTLSSTRLSIPGNQTFSWISCFVRTTPWCPWWAIVMMRSRRLAGLMILWSQRSSLPSFAMHNSSFTLARLGTVALLSWQVWHFVKLCVLRLGIYTPIVVWLISLNYARRPAFFFVQKNSKDNYIN